MYRIAIIFGWIVFWLLVVPGLSMADERYQCYVERIIDGDTFDCVAEISKYFRFYKGVRIRLAHVDTPEVRGLEKKKGLKVADHMRNLIGGKIVWLSHLDEDKYGRVLARVYIDSLYVNEYLVRNGMADIPRYDKSDEANRLRKVKGERK